MSWRAAACLWDGGTVTRRDAASTRRVWGMRWGTGMVLQGISSNRAVCVCESCLTRGGVFLDYGPQEGSTKGGLVRLGRRGSLIYGPRTRWETDEHD
jgi:hypothetical protein